jgi:putative FmdB family regulatory protein
MYEYECVTCGGHFDLLRTMHQSDTDVTCTECGSTSVRRALSLFAAVSTESANTPAMPTMPTRKMGGGCCGGACGCNN